MRARIILTLYCLHLRNTVTSESHTLSLDSWPIIQLFIYSFNVMNFPQCVLFNVTNIFNFFQLYWMYICQTQRQNARTTRSRNMYLSGLMDSFCASMINACGMITLADTETRIYSFTNQNDHNSLINRRHTNIFHFYGTKRWSCTRLGLGSITKHAHCYSGIIQINIRYTTTQSERTFTI